MNLRAWWALLRDAALAWWRHNSFQSSAALAYFTVVALAPLTIFVMNLAGLIFDDEAARTHMVGQVQELIGPQGAQAVELILKNARDSSGLVAAIFGLITLILGLLGVFFQLQSALNDVWEVTPEPKANQRGVAAKRFWSFALVLAIGFLLLVSLVLSAVLAALEEYAVSQQPEMVLLWQLLHFVLSLALITALFALMFRYLPDATIAWKDVWLGGAFTAVLFTVGKSLIGLYLGNSGLASAYGAAGSVVVVLVWVYYSGLILLLGAEITRLYANRFGTAPQPEAHARWKTQPTAVRRTAPRTEV